MISESIFYVAFAISCLGWVFAAWGFIKHIRGLLLVALACGLISIAIRGVAALSPTL